MGNSGYSISFCSGTGLLSFPVSMAARTFSTFHFSIAVWVYSNRQQSATLPSSSAETVTGKYGGRPHLNSPSPHMWQQHHQRIGNQTRMNLRFFFKNVKTAGADVTFIKGLHEGRFVHDGAPGGIDDYDAWFHLFEFGGADYVVGVFLYISQVSAV